MGREGVRQGREGSNKGRVFQQGTHWEHSGTLGAIVERAPQSHPIQGARVLGIHALLLPVTDGGMRWVCSPIPCTSDLAAIAGANEDLGTKGSAQARTGRVGSWKSGWCALA